MTHDEREIWLAIRKEAGLKIDPETAEVTWRYAHTCDPYGVYPDLPEEYQQVGREYFARSPGSEVDALITRRLLAPAEWQNRSALAAALHRYLDANPIAGGRW